MPNPAPPLNSPPNSPPNSPGDALEAVTARLESHVRSFQDVTDVQNHINAALLSLLFTMTNLVACHGGLERTKVVRAVEAALEASGDMKDGLCGYILRSVVTSLEFPPHNQAQTSWPPQGLDGGRGANGMAG